MDEASPLSLPAREHQASADMAPRRLSKGQGIAMQIYRLRVLIILLLVSASLLVRCQAGGTTDVTETITSPEQPTAGLSSAPLDTLRWSIEGDNDLISLDPTAPVNSASVTVIGFVFSGLIKLDEHLEVQPDGASSWEVSPDGTTYTFTIRENLKFADGTPVTAHDFVYSINRALKPETASFGAPFHLGNIVGAQEVAEGKARSVSGVRALDDRTLEIRLKSPQAYFLSQLSFPYTFVVPRTLVESGDGWEERAYGSGPFRVTEWQHGHSITLEANEYYWRGSPGFDRVVISFHEDSGVAYQRYLRGELDIMGSQQTPIPAVFVPDVQNRPDFKSSASLTTRYVGFNQKLPPFDDVRVRRAFALAVDKELLSAEVLSNTVIPAHRILPTGLLGTELPIRSLRFDVTAARAELAAAGFPDGKGFPQVSIAYATEGDNEIVARTLQRFWSENLGVKVDLQPYDLEDFIRALDTTYFNPSEGLQLYLSVWGADYPDPHNFLSQQLRSGVPNNNGHFSNAEFDRLVDEADRLAKPDDVDRRLQLYNQAEQIAIDHVGWLPLYYPKFNTFLRHDIEGMVVTPIGIAVPDWTKARRKQ
ncbi:MAG: ABC transporter substrate-binding protein [Herpetosiphonaceae bacterium]|nr:MAG: ABC transporter substrate-binding protein [Herpetosiphonaceae bacterium]